MHHERIDRRTSYAEGPFPAAGTGRHRAPAEAHPEALVPPDPGWDPAEELAFLLQDAMEQQAHAAQETDASAIDPAPGSPLGNLQEITAELPPLRDSPTSHRRVRRGRKVSRLRAASLFLAALAAVIAASVSLFGGMVAYEPLRLTAVSRAQDGVVSWWPLLVYGPWLVASLSVLRAALHRRRAVHSWAVVLLFSCIAMLLCVAQAPRTPTDTAAAALPGLASLICFQQVVRQITLTRPPRRSVPRHRQRAAPAHSGEPARDLPFPHQRHPADPTRSGARDRPARRVPGPPGRPTGQRPTSGR
ncbi:DUF2637 domain-containing protein [Streptomyces sp. TRM S81-3]|uniref:DUF2637 domain-containing protein n=1 Tax=Streptomyces griseicoloratus TaxID=2752516 RepID=A0A926L6Y9_9ACTN|nr:DUF2637 domain-containing protein [Streptomyces griseicoloratus]MBD0423718.1 DUF2637 domain-containing protein [Streptomyces griseicoloratus]